MPRRHDVSYATLEDLMRDRALPERTSKYAPMQLWVPREGLMHAVRESVQLLQDAPAETVDDTVIIRDALAQREEMLAWLSRQPEIVYILWWPTHPELEEDNDPTGV